VIHDWGSALGFDWANQHRDRVRGIVYMEGIAACRGLGGMERGGDAGVPGLPLR
jgi:haloalkane dehalogenase